jgi:Na+/proline symporter
MIPASADAAAATTVTTNTLKFIPPIPDASFFTMDFWESPFSKFLVFLTILWWSRDNSDGGGYIIQRMSSAKNEKHALLATLWFNLTHYAFRVWPWIIVAMVSIVAFPDVSEWALGDKVGYPLVMQKFLGPGMRGLLVISFLAAFMSTIDTHLNWGASYLINDIYKRFIKPEKSFSDQSKAQRHYVKVSRILTVFLMIFAALVAVKMQSIGRAWEFIFAMGAGIGLVLILRWFWWRINAWTEISALITSILITVSLEIIAGIQTVNAGMTYTLFGRAPIIFGIELQMHHKLLIIVPIAIIVWLTVTFLTKPEKESTLKEFYRRVQPGGWWDPISKDIPRTKANVTKGFLSNWLAGIAFIFGATFAIGNLIFGYWGNGILLTVISILGFAWIWKYTIVKLDSE